MKALIATSLLCLGSVVARGESPLQGDRENGAALFRVQCAACHGLDARGGGPLASRLSTAVGNLRHPAFLATRSEDDLRTAILKGVQRNGRPTAMPAAPWLSSLDLADLIVFLREGELRVADFFPQAQFLTAKTYPLDKGAQDRIAHLTGHALAAGAASVTLITVYGSGHGGGPEVVPQDPVALDKLDPKDGKGYLVFADLPEGKGRAVAGVALNRDGAVLAVRTTAGLQTPSLDKSYQSFAGEGKKGPPGLLKPKGKGSATLAETQAFNELFVRAIEAIDVADREEKDRHWADTGK